MQQSASIQPRTSLSDFGGDSIHFFNSLLSDHRASATGEPSRRRRHLLGSRCRGALLVYHKKFGRRITESHNARCSRLARLSDSTLSRSHSERLVGSTENVELTPSTRRASPLGFLRGSDFWIPQRLGEQSRAHRGSASLVRARPGRAAHR